MARPPTSHDSWLVTKWPWDNFRVLWNREEAVEKPPSSLESLYAEVSLDPLDPDPIAGYMRFGKHLLTFKVLFKRVCWWNPFGFTKATLISGMSSNQYKRSTRWQFRWPNGSLFFVHFRRGVWPIPFQEVMRDHGDWSSNNSVPNFLLPPRIFDPLAAPQHRLASDLGCGIFQKVVDANGQIEFHYESSHDLIGLCMRRNWWSKPVSTSSIPGSRLTNTMMGSRLVLQSVQPRETTKVPLSLTNGFNCRGHCFTPLHFVLRQSESALWFGWLRFLNGWTQMW